jgi:hypothetical protein
MLLGRASRIDFSFSAFQYFSFYPMHRAFVFSRPRDIPIASRCQAHLKEQGWHALLVLDSAECPAPSVYLPPNQILAPYAGPRGMHGVACAIGIAEAILAHSDPGDTVAKFDCDIRLTPTGHHWLAAAGTMAHAFALGPRLWGGCWSAPRNALLQVAARLAVTDECDCPESNLFLSGFRHHGGISSHATARAIPWLPGREQNPNAGCHTLPTVITTHPRHTAGLALFDG